MGVDARVLGARAVGAVLLLGSAAACTGGAADGTADLVVRYEEAGEVTEVRVTIDDVTCRESDTGRDVRSGPLDGRSPSGPAALVVAIRYELPGALLSLDLGNGRHYLAQEHLDAHDGGFRIDEHPGSVVTGYLTGDAEYVAQDAVLSGSVTC